MLAVLPCAVEFALDCWHLHHKGHQLAAHQHHTTADEQTSTHQRTKASPASGPHCALWPDMRNEHGSWLWPAASRYKSDAQCAQASRQPAGQQQKRDRTLQRSSSADICAQKQMTSA